MIPAKELKVHKKNYAIKVTKQISSCSACTTIDTALKGNSVELLSKLKINRVQCYCRPSATIFLHERNSNGKSGTVIGQIKVIQQKHGPAEKNKWETHSRIYSDLNKGKGLGLYLYSLAADWCARQGVQLQSSTNPSEFAQRVWKSKRLRQYYLLKRENQRWSIKPKKTTTLAWVGK